ncbi:ADP-ribosylglycohydrolase family protein [Streptomyces sp. AK08-02]|uniref:ADP-ribosylglycohydrolase family protein n=1 Tax=Streptomyces sp. AK08-02 TaxID=3028654 RepID=UPI0029B590BC|nr:ADP-ribosylglycohydrolase family protein [Streptomyces sp. AK08-02]MDX3750599.1 ADP-ribosylglycohydrolase family protein [Streptomyces sp. AK08-02]
MAHARTPQPHLDARGTDRAAGVLLGAAVGDALGVPYEFKARLSEDQQPQMIGGGLGPYEPGEYSDDTQMQVCIADVAATGADLRSPEALDAIAANFQRWLSGGASDVGAQTRTVLGTARSTPGAPGAAMLDAARHFTSGNDRAAGNGSLMRTGIVALTYLGDPTAMAEAAVAVSALTHPDPDCADACVLWCSGIRTAVLHGTLDGVRAGLDLIPTERRDVWAQRLDEAEANPPHHFGNNGWVVHALQAAWSAITRTAVPEFLPAKNSFPAQHLHLALEAAVRAGTDTDTVAAITGALLGARWGCSGIPLPWQQVVHGWPGRTGADLVRLAVLTARGGSDDAQGWPSVPRMSVGNHHSFAVPHPHDPGVVLGNLALTQDAEPVPVEAVVSLCRVGTDPILPGAEVEHVRVWLVDSQGDNANLHYVLDQAARHVLRLRQEGKRVLLHCLAGQSRTPAVAAIYSHLATGTDSKTALDDLRRVLTGGWQLPAHPEMHDAVQELTTGAGGGQPTGPGVAATDPITPRPAPAHSTPPQEQDKAHAEQRQEELDLGPDAEPARQREFLKEKGAVSRVRGMLLGLALGDTLGAARGKLPADGPLRARVSTQLACFTAEGIIRAWVRGAHKGICHPPSVVWHAYCRWAALQGIEVERMRKRWAQAWGSADMVWPDGWLAQVPVLAERRGSAPATVAALSKIDSAPYGSPTTSRGCHALTRTLPIAVVVAHGSEQSVELAREFAALTHGGPAAQSAAAHAAVLVSHCLTSSPQVQANLLGGRSQVQQALLEGLYALPDADPALTTEERDRLHGALQHAEDQPADAERLAKLAPDATAPSALLGGLYVAASFPDRAQVNAALSFAAGAPDGDSVTCVAGALLGAAHGVEALPVNLISRHELAWVLDTLARDLITELTDSPSGGGFGGGWDPHWWDRYPGW